MRILVLGDSHCRLLGKLLEGISSDHQIYTITVSRGIEPIMNEYREHLQKLYYFDPQVCFYHAGHNNLAFHKYYNDCPLVSRDVTVLTRESIIEIKYNFPKCKMVVSACLPRIYTKKSSLSSEDVIKYNEIAHRHQLRLAEIASETGYSLSRNAPLWLRFKKCIANPKYLSEDGLHLNDAGNRIILETWLLNIPGIFPSLPSE
jgi:hypothetical protein